MATLFVMVFFVAPVVFVNAQESIKDYSVQITINENSTINVFETIEYDFGSVSRHGIFRDIPVKYDAGISNRSVRVKVTSVSRDGFEEPYTEKRNGDDKRIKIGDAEKTISGVHTYRIGYVVGGAFNAFQDFDELYWNAIPHGWNVPINSATVKVTSPADFTQTSCFEGSIGSNTICKQSAVEGSTAVFNTSNLDAQNGVTVALALRRGAVSLPGPLQQFIWWLASNFVIFIPFFVFLYMYKKWNMNGRDAKGRGTIIARYEAPIQVTPIFLGSIVDGQLHNHDITADILYLAEQGFLTITRIEEKKFLMTNTEYILEWSGDEKELVHKEKLVAELLFGTTLALGEQVKLSELQKDKSLIKRRKKLKEHIDEELKRQGYFANKPHRTREKWIILPVVLGSFVFVFWFINILLSISLAISIVIIMVFGILMPKRTRKGAEIREHILGFKEFLSITEKERLDFHNAPERSPNEFMKNLPYAIALQVEKKWAKQFEGIHIEAPMWYRGGSVSNFAAVSFVSDLNNFNTSMAAGVTGAAQGGSGSSGGGFSGGGMGGGGGGSW